MNKNHIDLKLDQMRIANKLRVNSIIHAAKEFREISKPIHITIQMSTKNPPEKHTLICSNRRVSGGAIWRLNGSGAEIVMSVEPTEKEALRALSMILTD